jgi:hypothetical protein
MTSRTIAAVETLKAARRKSVAGLDALFASLQHRAFRGDFKTKYLNFFGFSRHEKCK